MASQAWLESSLQRSARLGLKVLARASRRSVDWTSTSTSQTPTTTTDPDVHSSAQSTPTELSDAFATMAEFMAHTTYQCKRFYDSGCCSEPSDFEKSHMFRFHTRLGAETAHPALPPKTHHHVEAADEDFYIEVSPGTYSVTASLSESQRQTQLVNVKAGESVNLTFNL
ncbi:A-kinase-interacting protein 1 [Salarias fasciatus]|uniref:A kinase (PRKA) interacting protein 1 n=1 Tax=Salarias fasciatus TaxID=181472 RepID=A0A672ILH1_SALFA|nr:A-kinase-interacting protein 1 [Salarias fasciatus]XP_029952518.1 A-kinase-interacting protein 1 [Salarias fasciatus]